LGINQFIASGISDSDFWADISVGKEEEIYKDFSIIGPHCFQRTKPA
jgi:hypothetical protein